jgi:hypothetical protein
VSSWRDSSEPEGQGRGYPGKAGDHTLDGHFFPLPVAARFTRRK